MRAAGLVLAAGRSRRFGSEKALAQVDGRPMVAAVAQVLASGCEAVAVNAPEGSGAAAWAGTAGLPVLSDRAGDPDGPLSGVRAGLAWAQATGADVLITSPCDTPGLPRDLCARLLAGVADAACAFAETSGGSHPLCAAWRLTLLPGLEQVLAEGHPSVRALLARWDGVAVRFGDAAAFANVNTPGDASTPARSTP